MLKNNLFKIFKINWLIYISSFLINILIAAAFFSSLDVEGYKEMKDGKEISYIERNFPISNFASIYMFYNSDALWMATLSDGIVNGNCYKGWDIGTCPNIFPSLPIFLILMLLFKNIILIQLINAFIQLIIFLILMNILYKVILPDISLYALSITNLIFSILLIVPIYSRDTIIIANLFLPFHIGAFINSLLAIIFILKYFKTNRTIYIFLFSIIHFLACYSDNIFLAFFTIPFSLTLVFFICKSNKWIVVKTFLVLLISLIASKYIYYISITQKWFYITTTTYHVISIKKSFLHLIFNLKEQIISVDLSSIVFIFIFLSIIFSIVFSIVLIKKVVLFWFRREKLQDRNLFQFYLLFFSIMTIGTFSAPVILGIFIGVGEIRYCAFSFFLALTNITLISFYFISKHRTIYEPGLSVIFIIIPVLFLTLNGKSSNPLIVIKKVKSYYPGIVRALDKLSSQYPLKNGVAEHWHTKYVTCLSRKGNKVIPIYDNSLLPRHFGNNINSIFYGNCNQKDTAFFNYIIEQGLTDTTFIYSFFRNNVKPIIIDGYKFYLVNDSYYDRNTVLPVITNKNIFKDIN